MPKFSNYKYHNITISGLPGSGSTTLLTFLKRELGADGWRGFNGGDFMRSYAAENGLFDGSQKTHHRADVYDDGFDRQVDMGMREKLETEQKWILESWLSGFVAQGVKGVLKVLLTCSDNSVRVDRIVNRDDVDVKVAKAHLQERYEANSRKWRRMYKKEWQEWVVKPGRAKAKDEIDFWRPDLYDIVIDTYSHSRHQTLRLVLNELKK